MREPRPVKVVLAREEHLGLRLELAEGVGMDDPVAVDLEGIPVVRLPRPAERLTVKGSVESVAHGFPGGETRASGSGPGCNPRGITRFGIVSARFRRRLRGHPHASHDDASDLQDKAGARPRAH